MHLSSVFYGWRVVALCFVAALFTWGFGVFGASVYLAQVTKVQGWSITFVSAGVTLFYLTNALSASAVGGFIDRYGSRPVFICGALALGAGIAGIGQVSAPWQLYAIFVLMGLGYAALSVTGISATIAPWFERHQGRSVAIALMGASMGAMLVVPLLAMAIERFGFASAVFGGGCLTILVMVPLSAVVLRYRRPRDLGLRPDGGPVGPPLAPGPADAPQPVQWTRAAAIRSPALWTAALAFALGLVVQVGFLTHHVKLAEPLLGTTGAGWLVSATGLAALMGRMLLAKVVDGVDVRRYTAGILATQAVVLGLIVLVPGAPMLIGASLVYGFCQGQVTTLSPIVVRREFGAASYGAIYGTAAMVIQFSSAFGAVVFGLLRDVLGSYDAVLAIAAAFELAAMIILLLARRPVAAPASADRT